MNVSLSNLNNEDLLLMYLSGELDVDAARQVEAQLARDENLRRQFELLKQIDGNLTQWAAEENSQPVARLDASLREALTMMRKHTLTSPLSKSEQNARTAASGWKWRMAIAALLVIGVGVMFMKRTKNEIAINPVNPQNNIVAINDNGTDFASMYDMFDAPVTELADSDSLIQDVEAVNQMAQMLK